MSDVERIMSEATKAQAEAEAAAQRAADLKAQAEVARQQAAQEQAARQRRWAQQVIDGYDADLVKAEQAVQAAGERFAAVVVDDLNASVKAYSSWAEAALAHYTLQARASAVAPILDLEASEPVHAVPPPFSEALDWAMEQHVATLSTKAWSDAQDEIRRMLDPSSSAAAMPATR